MGVCCESRVVRVDGHVMSRTVILVKGITTRDDNSN